MSEMRETLFRGKRTDNGKWIEGSLVHYRDISSIIVHDEQYYDRHKELPVFGVMPETRGQYTGLTDKNGRKIFEGDIIEAVYFHLGNEIHNKFVVNDICTLSSFPWSSYKDFGIIGNIHDNPELLE